MDINAEVEKFIDKLTAHLSNPSQIAEIKRQLTAPTLALCLRVRKETREEDAKICAQRVEHALSEASYKERAGQHEEALQLTAQAAGAQLCAGDIRQQGD